MDNTSQTTQSSEFPGPLVFGLSLILVGGVAQLLYTISPSAAYGFVLLVIMGYIGVEGRFDKVTVFLKSLGVLGG